MTLLLIAAIALCAFSVLFFVLADKASGVTVLEGLFAIIAGCCAFAAVIALITFACLGFGWTASEHRTRIINREYGTTYTQAEVFYASSVIETVRELDRKRIDARLKVNGDLDEK